MVQENVFTFELPKTGAIKLTWGMWAMKLFCDRKGVAVDDFFDIISNLIKPEGVDKKEAYECIIGFLASGYEAYNDRKPTEKEVCGWLDELGGIIGMHAKVQEYINWIVGLSLANVTPLPNEPEPEKKNEE